MLKKWLAVLGAMILVFFAIQLLWAGGGQGSGDEHPWVGATGSGTSSTVGPALRSGAEVPGIRIYLVQPAPMGGFYLLRVNLSSGTSAKASVGVKKTGN